ncbi:MAG: DUF72 domain-containing protein [Nanoarchaeota archaeon]
MKNKKKKFHIGTSGWQYKHWKKIFYPEKLPQKKWFEFYSENFSTVEVNYSFYRWPDEKKVQNWYEKAPKNFQFTLKAPRVITHYKKLVNVEDYVKNLYKLGDILKEKMGCFLFQMPPNFTHKKHNLNKLQNFLKILDNKKKNVIEFRDKSWWKKEIYDLLKKYKVTFCITSGLKVPEDIVTTSNVRYYRFHGENYSSKYSKAQIKKYANTIKNNNNETYAYFNNDNKGHAINNAKELKRELENA